MSIIYLAGPYTHPDPAVRIARTLAVDKAAAHFMDNKQVVYSPLTHGHRISEFMKTDVGCHRFWLSQCWPFLSVAKAVYVLTIPGWLRSKGVRFEVETAIALGIPVFLVNPDTYGLTVLTDYGWKTADVFK